MWHSWVRPAGLERHGGVARLALAHPVAATFLLAFSLRAALATVVFLLEGGVLFADEAMYTFMAKATAAGETENWDPYTHQLYRSTAAFMVPLTVIFKMTPAVLAGQLFVAALGAGVAALVARLALEVVSRGWSLAAGAAVALLPSQVLFTSLTLKDGAVWACAAAIALTVALAGRVAGARFWWFIGGVCLLLFLMAHLRAHTFVAACWAAALSIWIGTRNGRREAAIAGIVILLVLPVVVGQGVAGLGLVTDHGSLEERRARNAENAATAFVPDTLPEPDPSLSATGEGLNDEPLPEGTDGETPPSISDTPDAGVTQQRPGGDTAGYGSAHAEEIRDAVAEARALETTAIEESQRAAALEASGAAREAGEARVKAKHAEIEAARARARADRLARTTTTLAQGLGTAFSEDEDDAAASTSRNLRHLPKGLSAILLEPYPWRNPANPRVQLARAEMLVWYPLLAMAVVGLLAVRRHARTLLFPLLLSGAMALVYGLTEGNFGTAYRHRGELVWAVALLAAVGAATLMRWRSQGPQASFVEQPPPSSGPMPAGEPRSASLTGSAPVAQRIGKPSD